MAGDKGVWLDKDTGKVVTSKPDRARQLAAPGREPTNAELDAIERYKEAASGDTAAATTVTTSSAKSSSASKSSK